ncbi:Phosphoenolpyruvate carboxylase [Pseudoalteromonas holothuriae]|uniref:Phosphoenolpyruvate carboxylase n=1 Tax=Pseudoalteromonas holothuriae TaxID=2963714 RepID=A0A9W4R096_9GAMM|nr:MULTISPECIES: phosphoenolpyruvate carboxylase [unclassified Pseudoalteromonas]CAH9050708.1 Phosphoenolpyruvate carboxylase [Pseudoalteromonas sp. CIP111951]CAH9061348.1 Phosphoenolpyruvate carboxylase [Pseudoalteromonas sp. CIP111854]
MTEQYQMLRTNVSMLGELLGKTIKQAQGQKVLDKVEQIRKLSKSSRSGNEQDRALLIDTLHGLTDEELLPVARAFNHFLNLANVAEQFHTISKQGAPDGSLSALKSTLTALKSHINSGQINLNQAAQVIANLKMDLVLTAHPTEVTRRTIISKHVELSECLKALELHELDDHQSEYLLDRIEQLICQAWHTNDIRDKRPTPLDEAKWGFAVIENSLWHAVPEFVRQFHSYSEELLALKLPEDFSPITFTSWMGGDRDGNPFVTAQVTQTVLDHGRWMALDLYYRDLDKLSAELSMHCASAELKEQVGSQSEPYRYLLKLLKSQVSETIFALEHKIKNEPSKKQDKITHVAQLKAPLELIYRSLCEVNMGVIANGLLIDVIRRLNCFGVNLCKLDIRQDSARHTEVFSELTGYLGLGKYADWSEQDKQAFLLAELNSRRPLIPKHWQPSSNVQEVLDTFAVIANQDQHALGIYIISMAQNASDVLAVELLLQESGCRFKLPVAPLFETLDDLNRSAHVMTELFAQSWYRQHINRKQFVMIGYSDSAKDAGMMAAGWAQYSAMEKLVDICEQQEIELILFHGRGGTIGRGGAPAAQALHSQPPGSLKNGLRVTEQGEMIRFKFGLPKVAVQSLAIYSSAIIESNLLPPPQPQSSWQEVMALISNASCEHYRSIVRENSQFVPYFRMATPEVELAKLPLGSRPAKRNPNGGVESLRAIPWIFAWSQNRLMLPAWLGALQGLQAAVDTYSEQTLKDMSEQWPFFRTRLEMLEMVFCKADSWLSEHYEQGLVEDSLKPLGNQLRNELAQARDLVQRLAPDSTLLSAQPWIKESIALRNPYTDPLNMLQVELLNRARSGQSNDIDNALMITMTGIAAGMRNTG